MFERWIVAILQENTKYLEIIFQYFLTASVFQKIIPANLFVFFFQTSTSKDVL